MNIHDLPTPALLIDVDALDHDVTTMASARPGARLRPHVKAHKCTALPAAEAAAGYRSLTRASPRDVLGMAAAGLVEDLLVANETVDPRRLAATLTEHARETRVT